MGIQVVVIYDLNPFLQFFMITFTFNLLQAFALVHASISSKICFSVVLI